MSTYALSSLLKIQDSSGGENVATYRKEASSSITEKADNIFIVAGATTDFAVSFGGVSDAEVLWLESLTDNESWSFKLNGTGNTSYTVVGKGVVVLSKATVTSLHITVSGANPVTFRVVVVS